VIDGVKTKPRDARGRPECNSTRPKARHRAPGACRPTIAEWPLSGIVNVGVGRQQTLII